MRNNMYLNSKNTGSYQMVNSKEAFGIHPVFFLFFLENKSTETTIQALSL